MKKLEVVEKVENGHLVDVHFDITLIVDKDNNIMIVDNSVEDWKDYVDCNTLLTKDLKLRP